VNGARAAAKAMLASALALAALWAIDFFLMRPAVLTPFEGRAPLTPLYAFWLPALRPQLVVFAALAAAIVLLAPRLVDLPARTFALALALLALALPLALFLVRDDLPALGAQFTIYPGEEFFDDAARIGDPWLFLRHFVELMPRLSLHGRHFPPGHALLLFVTRSVAGPSPLAAGVAVLAIFAAGAPIAWLALRRLVGELPSRQGALLLLASPSLLDFACTSMDAVFFTEAALAWWLSLRALDDRCSGLAASARRQRSWLLPGAHLAEALLAGAALALAALASFSVAPLGLAVALYALARCRQRGGRALVALVIIGLGFATALALLYALTGFNWLASLLAARSSNSEFMSLVAGRPLAAIYGRLAYGNLSAFLIGAGVALLGALALRFQKSGAPRDAWSIAALAAFAVLVFGNLHQMETERIWLYALPWLPSIALSAGALSTPALRALLAGGFVQALLMEALLFTLW
jgi:hypothetical protein